MQACIQEFIQPPKPMDKIVPLIGSAEVGPLGVLHLPRLWLKVSLDAKGALADGYPAVGTGFDQMVLDGLGLKKGAVIDFIKQNRPTYCQFESWIKGNRLVKRIVDGCDDEFWTAELFKIERPRR
jgi:hypothetical protein